MLWALKTFYVAGALLVLQSLWAFIDGLRFLRFVRTRRVRSGRGQPAAHFTPAAAVVIPCKGVDAGFEQNLNCFLEQDYPAYQVVFAVADMDDAAYSRLSQRLAAPSASERPVRTALVVAGLAENRGEKVHNLLKALEAVDPAAEVLVFADIDATPATDWLASLVEPLADARITASTGFRWYLPGKGFASRLRAAWDASIATMMGDHDHNFAWGGSMAIRTADFCQLRVADQYWQSTVSDDYALTRAVRDARGKIAFVPQCLVASREESSLREFLHWSHRQIIITRVYAAHLWKLGLATYGFYCGTLLLGVAALAMAARPGARVIVAAILGAVLALGAAKGFIRTLVSREMFASQTRGTSCYWLLSPLVPWVMLWNFVAAGLTRRIEWRGTEYELVSPSQVRVLRRGRTSPGRA
jgi:ceramide glucosyltransferase